MTTPSFVNGKAHLEECYNCGESRAAVKHSQSIKNPIYCVKLDSYEGGSEVSAEWDRHRFVITEKAYQADLKAESDWLNSYEEVVK